MAKAPWEKYATASKKVGWVTKKAARSTKPGKSAREKLIEAIDKQQKAFAAGEISKGSWFRPHNDGDVVKGQVRYGTQPLKLVGDTTYLEMPHDMVGQFYSDIRAAAEAGKFDAQLDVISESMSARRRG